MANNNAKLREAVVLALSLLDLKEGVPYKTVSQKDLDFIKNALAEPPRNCDVGTAEEQSRRFCAFCRPRTEPCDGCACLEGARKGRCEFVWAQMPYESEAAK